MEVFLAAVFLDDFLAEDFFSLGSTRSIRNSGSSLLAATAIVVSGVLAGDFNSTGFAATLSSPHAALINPDEWTGWPLLSTRLLSGALPISPALTDMTGAALATASPE